MTGLEHISAQPGHRHMAEVCALHGVTRDDLRSWNKARFIVNARKEFWFRLKIILGWSWSETARATRKDHTTALYGVRQWAHKHLGTRPKASQDEIAAAWAGYLTAIEFLLFLALACECSDYQAMGEAA
jgi:chromosomal replication initiation ATPase DnaA